MVRRSCRLVLVVVLVALALAGPLPALAQMAAGNSATVQADGDGLILRDGPGYDAAAIDLIPDGTIVGIMDGPFYAEDGSVWYYVSLSGDVYGYVVSDWLVERVFPDPGPGQTGSGTVVYLAGEWCGADDSWLSDSLYRLDGAVAAWDGLEQYLSEGRWGLDLAPYRDHFSAASESQRASAFPPAAQALQDATIGALDAMALGSVVIMGGGLGASVGGFDFDEQGSYANRDAEVEQRLAEVDYSLAVFLAECTA